ncbi:hypothetical protein PsalN5692_01333 [Piscirickettsia salmonis]|uniref:hypothetical protein n=1 Tax=Piscirickettsia salmonis TaxID=1238 RepID=UPI0012B72ECD|nr:hypothetical protein [Piscirickettsia salmonis]QGP49878.1 hypothetical protein PsalN5692_01333 [Piscirickettsia salmonis]QGP55061.1 hypothetical protein PsalSR1_02504 [Piscirickettsia salmonis]QGP59072.1 hypothetical protein PsalBI1_01657 [Piscirickettsia salmonis]QGP64628.1 hypothetical protein PsalMR5_02505 [Piscirickettsia salmonis]
MLKQIIIIIVCSILVVIFGSYLHYVLNVLLEIYQWIHNLLNQIFSQGMIAKTLSGTLALLITIFFFGGVITCIFWVLKRPAAHAFLVTAWGIWLLLIPLIYLNGSGTL